MFSNSYGGHYYIMYIQGIYMHQAYAPSEESRTPPTPYLGLSRKKNNFSGPSLKLKTKFFNSEK